MKISVSTLGLYPAKIENVLNFITEQKLDYLEIIKEYPYNSITSDDLNSYDIGLSIHAPMSDVNIASHIDKIRDTSVELMIDSFKTANEWGADRVVVHPGSIPVMALKYPEKILKYNIESLIKCQKAAEDYGVMMCVENMPLIERALYTNIEALFDDVDSELHSGITMDVGHGHNNGFTEIHTPKLGAKSAEGGANLFKLEYFHRPAILQQSPQFYKQMMVGVFDRVFETAPVFRAEKHNTKRHLNEYTSLDFEMGYIDGFEDIMEMETGFLQYTMELLKTSYAKELELLKIKLPDVTSIPRVRFDEAKQRVAEKYNRQFRNPFDLEPEEEVLIGQYFKEEYGSDFVFVTHYPSKKRPFYAMDDPADETYTLSFDLLFRGLEITTGGQRIHDYNKLMEKIAKRGMETEGMESYLSAFKHGMPPHGGLGIGLERLTMQLIGEDNVREATLFPRDLSRLEP